MPGKTVFCNLLNETTSAGLEITTKLVDKVTRNYS